MYTQLKEEQDLKSDFAGFQTMLIKLIQSCITDPEHFKSVIVMNSDSTANLNFFQMLEYKRLSLLEVVLNMGEEDEINAHASFRYKMKSLELSESLNKLKDLVNIVKKENPSLI